MTRESAQGVIARIETLPKLTEATRSLVGAATWGSLTVARAEELLSELDIDVAEVVDRSNALCPDEKTRLVDLADVHERLGAEALGAVLVIVCMVKCYLLPARPLWNTPLTPVSFVASANLLGLPLYLVLTDGALGAAHALNVAGTLLVLLAVQSLVLRRFGFWPALIQPVGDWRDVRALYVLRIVLAAAVLLSLVAETPLEPLFVLLALGEFLGRVLFYKLSPATGEFGALHV